MRMHADIDLRELEHSITRAAKNFGEANRQGVARWGVQTARELAVQTQPFGRDDQKKRIKKNQADYILLGMHLAVQPVKTKTFNRMSKGVSSRRVLASPDAISNYIDTQRSSRTGRVRGTRSLEKPVCKLADFKRAYRMRVKRIGAAKGPWLGAGIDIGKAQRGRDQIRIGKNYFGFAQKFSHRGSSRRPTGDFRVIASLTNGAKHINSSHVLRKSAQRNALEGAARAVVKGYEKAAQRALSRKRS